MIATNATNGFERATGMRRREFLWSLASTGLLACGGAPATTGPAKPVRSAVRPLDVDALGQAERVRRGDVTARELVLDTIARIEALDGPINAVTTRFFERALDAADGPLPEGPFHGVPFLLKDLNDLAGTRKTMGSRMFAGFISRENSPNAQSSLDAGFVILGKTNTPEFGLVATTESALLGPCRNPWNLDHSSGGSSGGAAAAVAAGMLPMAQASDGGGSIRIPASCCGLFGLKPSRGRNPVGAPKRPISISVKHVVSRSVRDSAAYLSVTERRDAQAPLPPAGFVSEASPRRLRIAFHTANSSGVEAHPDIKSSIEGTARLCEELGHRVFPAMPDYQGEEFLEHFLTVWSARPAALRAKILADGGDPGALLEPVTLGLADHFERRTEGALERAVAFLHAYGPAMDPFFDDVDVLLSPVLRTPPVRIGTLAGTLPIEKVLEPMLDYASYTGIWNAAGNPAMSVPLGWSANDLPIGSHFTARLGDEATLLALAYELEDAQPWAGRRPPVA